jgi:hypothetical protein
LPSTEVGCLKGFAFPCRASLADATVALLTVLLDEQTRQPPAVFAAMLEAARRGVRGADLRDPHLAVADEAHCDGVLRAHRDALGREPLGEDGLVRTAVGRDHGQGGEEGHHRVTSDRG